MVIFINTVALALTLHVNLMLGGRKMDWKYKEGVQVMQSGLI